MILRKYKTSDCENLAKLFFETVHSVNAKDYSKEELNAWATGNVTLDAWDKSFLEHYTIVALEKDMIIGFGDIDKTGYLDRLYVHKDYQGQGVATAICDDLENAIKVNVITTHSSITALSFFLNRGYKKIKEQIVERNGVQLKNYIMEKKV